MKIDWSKIDEHTAVHCDTEEKAIILLKENEKHGGNKYDGNTDYKDYHEETCYNFEKDSHWAYCERKYYQNHGYHIIEFDDIVINNKPKVAEILNLEIGDTYNFDGYFANPCTVNENYDVVSRVDKVVKASLLIIAINDPSTMVKVEKPKPKELTIAEIENLLGYTVKIVK